MLCLFLSILYLFPGSSARYHGMQLDAVYVDAVFRDKKNSAVHVKLHFYDKHGIMWIIGPWEEILIHQYDNNKKLIRTTSTYVDMSKAPYYGPWHFQFLSQGDIGKAPISVQWRSMKTGLIHVGGQRGAGGQRGTQLDPQARFGKKSAD